MQNKIEVIVIEGVDLSGKTTLWNQVIKSFPGIGMKITARPLDGTAPEREKIKAYYRSVLSFINQNYQNKTIIMDRFFPSELVYSKVKRDYEARNDPEFQTFESVLAKRNHLIIYCDPTLAVLVERLKARGDDYIKESDLRNLYDRYEEFMKKTELRTLRLDTNLPVETLIEQIKKAL